MNALPNRRILLIDDTPAIKDDFRKILALAAASAAHEINNPLGFIQSNIGALDRYHQALLGMLAAYEAARPSLGSAAEIERLKQLGEQLALDLGKEDLPVLMGETRAGIVGDELRNKADVVEDYGALPAVECLPAQLNQVIMSPLVNAAQAIGAERGRLDVRSEPGQGTCFRLELPVRQPVPAAKPDAAGQGATA